MKKLYVGVGIAASLLAVSLLMPTMSNYNKTISTTYSIDANISSSVNQTTEKTNTLQETFDLLVKAASTDNAFSSYFADQPLGTFIESEHENSTRDYSTYTDLQTALKNACSQTGLNYTSIADYGYSIYYTGTDADGNKLYDYYITPIDLNRAQGTSGDNFIWPVYKYTSSSTAYTVGSAKLNANYVTFNDASGSQTGAYVYYLDKTTYSTSSLPASYDSNVLLGQSFFKASTAIIKAESATKSGGTLYKALKKLTVGGVLNINSNNQWKYSSEYSAQGFNLSGTNYRYTIKYEGTDASGNKVFDFYLATYPNNGDTSAYTSFIYRKAMAGTGLTPVEGVSSGYFSSGAVDTASFSSDYCKVLTLSY
jgi:hypothetical protein